jgi:FkbM family methyltransferase
MTLIHNKITRLVVDSWMKHAARRLVRAFGYDVRKYRPHDDPFRRLQFSLQRRKVTVILDVGANEGQFARAVRKVGYRERIISFEPLSEAHAKLLVAAEHDPLWTVGPRCALGSRSDNVRINISANSESSSLLKMLERHVAGDPQSAYIGVETVTMTTLDGFLAGERELAGAAIALKIDTQGYEAEVLAGLDKWSDNVEVILVEMSLSALYEGEVKFLDLYRMIEDRGYHCISIERGFTDPRTYEVLQVDAIFER